jgi:16S rRNA (cytidine1402-2'-O)-methyltransferase
MAQLLIETLQPSTLLCIALSLTTPRQRVHTQKVLAWKKELFSIDKEPAVFLLK